MYNQQQIKGKGLQFLLVSQICSTGARTHCVFDLAFPATCAVLPIDSQSLQASSAKEVEPWVHL